MDRQQREAEAVASMVARREMGKLAGHVRDHPDARVCRLVAALQRREAADRIPLLRALIKFHAEVPMLEKLATPDMLPDPSDLAPEHRRKMREFWKKDLRAGRWRGMSNPIWTDVLARFALDPDMDRAKDIRATATVDELRALVKEVKSEMSAAEWWMDAARRWVLRIRRALDSAMLRWL